MENAPSLPRWKPAAWTNGLLAWVIGLLTFETLTGLSIWALPFGIPNQMAVLAHTGVGIVFLGVYGWYQATHFWYNRDADASGLSWSGYGALAATLVAIASGVVLTAQALWGREVGYWWRFTHRAATVGVIGFVLLHLGIDVQVYAAPLEEAGGEVQQRLRAAIRRTGTRALLIAGSLGMVALLAALPYGSASSSRAAVDSAGGASSPFEPSLARTASGETIDPEDLGGSASCGASGCHRQIYREWRPSAHRYSALDTAFQAVQGIMQEQEGTAATSYCGGCHDPVSLFAGTKRAGSPRATHPVGRQEGVSCLACHATEQVDVRGNGDFVVDVPERYLFWEADDPVGTRLNHFLIRANPRKHNRSLQPELLRTPEFCGGCHKQFVGPELTDAGWVGLQNQYDNWRKSRWNHPGQPSKTIQCRECHMPLVDSRDPAAGDPHDYNRTADDGKHRSHRFLGGNQFIPTVQDLEGGEKHVELTEKWLRGEIEIPEIADKWNRGPAVPLGLDAPRRVATRDTVPLALEVVNNKPGHNFPTGPLDLMEAWVQVVATDRAGDTIFASGVPGPGGELGDDAFLYRARPVDEQGHPILRHELWELVGTKDARSIYPGYSDRETMRFTAPAAPTELQVDARLQYRKFNPPFRAFLSGPGDTIEVPITTISDTSYTITVSGDGDE